MFLLIYEHIRKFCTVVLLNSPKTSENIDLREIRSEVKYFNEESQRKPKNTITEKYIAQDRENYDYWIFNYV